MYRFHIKPITPNNAPEKIASVYKDITEVLKIPAVPLVFQYIALYDQYFFYLWDRIRVNLLSDDFIQFCADVNNVTTQTVPLLPTPSTMLSELTNQLHPQEKCEITQIVNVLDDTNIKLMLLTIGIRESLKSVPKVAGLLPEGKKELEETLDDLWQVKDLATQTHNQKEMAEATRMLAPLLGNNSIIVTCYSDFFGRVAAEMDVLKDMPAYLHLRVELEHQAFAKIDQFVQPLDCSYIDFMRMNEGKPYTDEILFLLKDTFASHFPHLVLTTSVMKNALADKSSAIVPQ
ncbi:MAG: hypothetical protein ACREHC_07950 [Candidatus Levyibacteriota bacterium]